MYDDMDKVLNESTDKVFQLVAGCFASGGGDKKAKPSIKEELRQVWLSGYRKAEKKCGDEVVKLGEKFKDMMR